MAATAGSAGAVNQLDYFDALERRSTVTWDELLAGVLLAAGRRADGTFTNRLQTAQRAAIVPAQAAPAPNALATPGDLAKLLLRAQGIRLRDTLTDDEALSLASRRSLVPANLNSTDPLTGAVAVRALAAAGQPIGNSKRPTAAPEKTTSKPSAGGSNP
jgi:hypothetical protein